MKRILTAVALAAFVVLGSAATAQLTYNSFIAETRGTVPLERLAQQGTPLERRVTRALADSLRRPEYFFSDGRWHVARSRSPDGDTIHFRVFRSRDARLPGRALAPDPYVSGAPRYIVSEGRFESIEIGIR
jgi:hypothetical protein